MSVFVVGALHLDVIVDAPRLPRIDETLAGHGVRYAFGGKGGNQAVAAARMGATVVMAGRVGTDEFAARLLAELDAAGVDRAQVQQGDGASGMSVAVVEDGGEYAAVIVSAANLRIDSDAIRVPDGARLVCLQNEIPETVNLAVARAARSRGIPVMLNAAPARPMAPDWPELCDILVVNRVEAGDMAGTGDPETAATDLIDAGYGTVVLTLGAQGAFWRSGTGGGHLPAHRIRALSTHGAGDAFAGALAARLAEGAALTEALGFAQAAAALHVATPPENRSALNREQVDAFRS